MIIFDEKKEGLCDSRCRYSWRFLLLYGVSWPLPSHVCHRSHRIQGAKLPMVRLQQSIDGALLTHRGKKAFLAQFNYYRSMTSRFLVILSLSSLIGTAVLTAMLLCYCWVKGDWPFKYWGSWDLNHGPWGYNFLGTYDGRLELLCFIFILLISSLATSFVAMLLDVSRFTLLAFSCALLGQWFAMCYLYWLVD